VPFTPFHLGPALLFGLSLSAVFDLPTLLVASVIPDVEPFYVMYFDFSGYPLHGFFHSYLGSSILAVLVAVVVYPLRNLFSRIMAVFRISQKSSFKKILFTSFVGVYSHVFLDSFLYEEMSPFTRCKAILSSTYYPPTAVTALIYGFCSITGLLGVLLYFFKIRKGVAVLN